MMVGAGHNHGCDDMYAACNNNACTRLWLRVALTVVQPIGCA